MSLLKDRRLWVAGGAALAAVAGLSFALLVGRKPHVPAEPPPASQAGLVVQTGRDDDVKLDPMRPLRCFVAGQFVGELPLSDCAKRNGVATGALDVGLDVSGALAATNGPSRDITPLPPGPTTNAEGGLDTASPAPQAVARATGACWRYAEGAWSPLPGDPTVEACAQTLFAGQCVRPGGAIYGRWGNSTLRLVPGRIEIASDNRNFHYLAASDEAC